MKKISKRNLKTNYTVREFSDGLAPVCEHGQNFYQYIDENGNLSEEKFLYAQIYSDGFAAVKKDINSQWRFRDTNGKLSRGFWCVESYKNGFALIQETKDSPLRFIDTRGFISKEKFQTFSEASATNPQTLTYEQTSVYDLSPEVILKNIDEIKEKLILEYQRLINACSNEKQMQEVMSLFEDDIEYVKSIAFEQYNKKIEDSRKDCENKILF